MAILAIVNDETYNGLDDSLKAHYTKQEAGGYLLDVTAVGAMRLQDASNLKDSLSKERDNVAKAQAELKASNDKLALFGEYTPEAITSLEEKVSKMGDWTPEEKMQEMIDQQVNASKVESKKIIDALKQESGALRAQLSHEIIYNEARSQLAKVDLIDGGNELLLPHVTSQMKLFDEDGKLVPYVVNVNGDKRTSLDPNNDGHMTLEELVTKAMPKEPKFQGVYVAQQAPPPPPRSNAGYRDENTPVNNGNQQQSLPTNVSPTDKLAAARSGGNNGARR